MKNILVPVDFTDVSDNALKYAVEIAKELEAGITLLHAYYSYPLESPVLLIRQKEDTKQLKKEAEDKLTEMCDLIKENSNSKCDYRLAEGLPSEVIISAAKEIAPDMLIIGTESLTPMDKMLFGTVAGKVVKNVECTLLIIPEDIPFAPFKKVGLATNYDVTNEREVEYMVKFGRRFNAEVHIIHVVTVNEDIDFEKRFFNDFQQAMAHSYPGEKILSRLLKGNNVVGELEKYVAVEDINVMAVVKTHKNPIARFLSGSTTQKLFNNLHCPLLVLHSDGVNMS